MAGMSSVTSWLAFDCHGKQIFEGDVVRNINKPDEKYTVYMVGSNNMITVYRNGGIINASQVELVMRAL